MSALEAANRVRYARADLKDAIHDDPTWRTLVEVIEGGRGAELVRRDRVDDWLTHAPRIGRVKARSIIAEAGFNRDGAIRFGWLTPTSRAVLARAALNRHKTHSMAALQAVAATPRDPKRKAT